MLPIVLLSYDRLFLDAGDVAGKRRRMWTLHAPFIGLALRRRHRPAGRLRGRTSGDVTIEWRMIFDEAGVVWRYAGLLLMPRGQSILITRSIRFDSLLDPRGLVAVVAAAAIVFVVALAWRLRQEDPIARFGVIWFFLLLVPSSLSSSLDQAKAWPSIAVLQAADCSWWPARRSAGSRCCRGDERTAAPSGRHGLCRRPAVVWRTHGRAQRRLERPDRSGAKPPTRRRATVPARVLGNRCTSRDTSKKRLPRTVRRFAFGPPSRPRISSSVSVSPRYGRMDDASATFEAFRRIDPSSTFVPTGLGAVALMSGQPDRARAYFLDTLQRDPRDVMARQWLAILEEDMQRIRRRRCAAARKFSNSRLDSFGCGLASVEPGALAAERFRPGPGRGGPTRPRSPG